MSDQLEDLIKEIAANHGVVVSRDDPILVLQTINNRLLHNSAQAQQAQLDRYKEALEDLALRWGNDAKGRAERILNASLSAGKGSLDQSMQEAARTISEAVGGEIDGALSRLRNSVHDAHRIALLNLVAACITMTAAAVALWAVLS